MRKLSRHINYKDAFIEGEIWKPVKDFEGLYEVSDLGRIKSLPKVKGRFLHTSHFVLNQKHTRDGYMSVSLSRDKKMKCCAVHRLVAIAFLDNPDNLREVNHIDLNKKNNSLNNLEWISSKENKLHCLKHGRLGSQKLTWDQVNEIRELRKQGFTVPKLVSMFPVGKTAISNIIYNQSWVA